MKIKLFIYTVINEFAIVKLFDTLERFSHWDDCISEAGWRHLEDLENKD
jgi:hypothetical protein